jgi:hypothetical protein
MPCFVRASTRVAALSGVRPCATSSDMTAKGIVTGWPPRPFRASATVAGGIPARMAPAPAVSSSAVDAGPSAPRASLRACASARTAATIRAGSACLAEPSNALSTSVPDGSPASFAESMIAATAGSAAGSTRPTSAESTGNTWAPTARANPAQANRPRTAVRNARPVTSIRGPGRPSTPSSAIQSHCPPPAARWDRPPNVPHRPRTHTHAAPAGAARPRATPHP